jgi:hypothetical protein
MTGPGRRGIDGTTEGVSVFVEGLVEGDSTDGAKDREALQGRQVHLAKVGSK